MRRSIILAAASSLAFSAVPALAQEASPIAVGATVNGEITGEDATADDVHYDGYSFQARRGQRFEINLSSDAFDAYLELRGPGGEDGLLDSDDDGAGEGTNSRLRFTATEDGTYQIRARPLGEGEGAYTLRLAERPPAGRPPRPAGIRIGQSQNGQLSDTDPETDTGDAFDAYSWRARQGERVAIVLESEDFDPVVRIGRMNGGAFEQLGENDDGGEDGLNSRLVFTAPSNGEYVIRAMSLSGSAEGRYRLALEEGPPPVQAQPIAVGDTANGELANDSKTSRYRFTGRAGQRVRVEMSSDDFDAFLELFDSNEASLATDDDGSGDGTDSRLIFTLPADGDYLIEARAFSEGTGDYTLKLSEMEPEKAPETLAFGAKIEGEIGEGDSTDNEDRTFDAFTFEGREGQRVRAIMRSGDFDTFLQVGAAEGEFSALGQDDDGLGEGTDSRLNFTIPEDGTYVLRASPLGADGKGLYSLELIDRGPQPEPGSILVGSTARGTLSESDATAEDNSFYDAYRVTLRKDEKLLITMVSNEVDSYLTVGQQKGEAFESMATDDDGLSDTHAKIEWTAPEDGTYEIRAGSFQQGQTGAYAMTVEKQP
ncbi:PPC domain-containing protein [Brevundimonas sp. NPDC092305]|uniref:PPC domain-containing protein n=1 Tax=Brevundimonas sp. NPDC092305 TaxID=3363957 RepID=UPI00380C7515